MTKWPVQNQLLRNVTIVIHVEIVLNESELSDDNLSNIKASLYIVFTEVH